MQDFEKRLNLLSKPVWSISDIKFYFDVKSNSTALQKKNDAIKRFNGKCSYGTKYVKVESVLALYDTTVEREAERLRKLRRAYKNVKEEQ